MLPAVFKTKQEVLQVLQTWVKTAVSVRGEDINVREKA